jgi:acetyl-CoA synthetase
MNVEKIPATEGRFNLGNYDEVYANFDWAEVEKQFTWHETGKVNMAYEAIDRHVLTDRKDKTALIYSDLTRDETYTYAQLSELSNKFGNVLRGLGIAKGDRVFVFMPRTPELYVSVLGTLKVGAIVGPLFEAFMEAAVRDRLENSEAVAIITTPALLPRIGRWTNQLRSSDGRSLLRF